MPEMASLPDEEKVNEIQNSTYRRAFLAHAGCRLEICPCPALDSAFAAWLVVASQLYRNQHLS